MFERLFRTEDDVVSLMLRVALGIVMFPHGVQMVLGWFGGYGLAGTWGYMTGQAHIPAIFAALAIAPEFAGSLGLIVGLLGRVAAVGVGVAMAVAAFVGGHVGNGFFMNWMGTQKGEGIEYHLLALAMAAALLLRGAGAFSLDRALSE